MCVVVGVYKSVLLYKRWKMAVALCCVVVLGYGGDGAREGDSFVVNVGEWSAFVRWWQCA